MDNSGSEVGRRAAAAAPVPAARQARHSQEVAVPEGEHDEPWPRSWRDCANMRSLSTLPSSRRASLDRPSSLPHSFRWLPSHEAGDAELASPLLKHGSVASDPAGIDILGRSTESVATAPEDAIEALASGNGYHDSSVEDVGSSSSLQTAFNATNVLCGVGILTTPYALALSGFAILPALALIGAMACYTGMLISACMSSRPGIHSYPDIGSAAFGRKGRILAAVLLYMELFSCCINFIILEGDNLAALFPGARWSMGQLQISAKQTFVLVTFAVVLPTVWLRDLSLLSYFSALGIFASAALVAFVGWDGVTTTGFHGHDTTLVVWGKVPLALGIYSFCFSGHAVFPSLYSGMKRKSQFPMILVSSFSLVVLIYTGMAVLGYMMFGNSVSNNISLDLQRVAPNAIPTRLVMWLVIVNPLTKLGLTLAPVALAIEECVSTTPGTWPFLAVSLSIRSSLLALAVIIALAVPFFAYVMAFIGSILSMSVSIVLPCIFYLKMMKPTLRRAEVFLAGFVACFGSVMGAVSTYQSVQAIVGSY